MTPPQKYMHAALLVMLSSLAVIFPAVSFAQMFSIEEPERRASPASNALSFGLDFIDMNLRSDSGEITNNYNFSEPVYRLRLDLPGIEVYAGYRTRLGDAGAEADTINYLNLGANVSGAMSLARNKNRGIMVPMWLSTDFLRVESTEISQPEADKFRQSSASIGIGAGGFLMISNRIRVRAELVPQIGFTVSALGSDSGQVGSVNGRVRMHADQIIGRFGLVVGYNYNWRRYSGGDERFQYDISSHNALVGVSF